MQTRVWQSVNTLSVLTTQMVIGHTYEEEDIGDQILEIVGDIIKGLKECPEYPLNIEQRRCFQCVHGRCLELEAYLVILNSNVLVNQHLLEQCSDALASLQTTLVGFIEELKMDGKN